MNIMAEIIYFDRLMVNSLTSLIVLKTAMLNN